MVPLLREKPATGISNAAFADVIGQRRRSRWDMDLPAANWESSPAKVDSQLNLACPFTTSAPLALDDGRAESDDQRHDVNSETSSCL